MIRLLSKKPSSPRAFLLEMFGRNSVGAEIGVHQGDFSSQILDAVRPARLHLIDPWIHMNDELYKEAWYGGQVRNGQSGMDARYQAVLDRFRSQIASGIVQVHRGLSSDVCRSFPDNYFDWVYIDGNHLYEFVRDDLELYSEKVKPGGYLTGDDYGEGGWWNGGVKKAVDEFVRNRPVDLIMTKNRQFVLRKQ